MTQIEIIGPEPDEPIDPIPMKNGNVLIWCECTAAEGCPQGKRGSQIRCRVWVPQTFLTAEAIIRTVRQNTFSR